MKLSCSGANKDGTVAADRSLRAADSGTEEADSEITLMGAIEEMRNMYGESISRLIDQRRRRRD